MKKLSDSDAFQTLLHGCGSWLTKEKGINEIPSVFLTVGSGDNTQTIELTAWSFIIETMQADYKRQVKHLFGVIPVIVEKPTGTQSKVCSPSFGVQDYNTKAHGPVWIIGTPLFYQYTVGFGMKPPTVAFSKGKCGSCNETTTSLLSSGAQVQAEQGGRARPMRTMSSTPRVTPLDTSLPL